MSNTEQKKKESLYLYPFQNPDLPLETRVEDLVSRFTLEEKVALMWQYQMGVERLGVKAYKHGTEAAHGMAWLGEATVFPQPIGLACTWDRELMQEVGSAIGEEARAFHKRNPEVNGLTLWAPTVDMERDPRWGRTEEAYGEDPYLTGELTSALIQGIQGDHPFYFKAVATLKHFLGNNNEKDRGKCSASIDPRNMKEYYWSPFKSAFIKGGAYSMMTAYNSVNGTPCILNPDVNKVVKKEWGMNGFVVSDAGDMLGTVQDHQYYETYQESVAGAIKNGIDSITDDGEKTKKAIYDALAEGLLTEKDLDQALQNTFRVRFRLGEFDPEERNPYAGISEAAICAPEHQILSREVARKSIVLLKNEHKTLPLDADKLQRIAVIGPLGDRVYTDWYSGTPAYTVTPRQGIEEKMDEKSVVFAEGCDQIRLISKASAKYVGIKEGKLAAYGEKAEDGDIYALTDWGWGSNTLQSIKTGKYVTTDDIHLSAEAEEVKGWFVKEVFGVEPLEKDAWIFKTWNGKNVETEESGILTVSADKAESTEFYKEVVKSGIQEAVEAAKTADAAIVFVGNNPFVNGKEEMDRPDITLPPAQEALIQAVYDANPNTIVVVVGSYPFAINWAENNIPAIVYTSHAGQELGNAVADVLFGNYGPAGRLNMTWYQSTDQLPDIMDYDIIKGKRTYLYFDGVPLYSFGHGLTYGEFQYSKMEIDKYHVQQEQQVTIAVEVENIGTIDSDEVVQLYVRANACRVKRPQKELKGFERIHLKSGEKKRIVFVLSIAELTFWDVTRERFCVESGTYTIMVGRSSGDILLTKTLEIEGEIIPPRDLRAVTQATNYDDYAGVILEEGEEGNISTKSSTNGSWMMFRDVDFSKGVSGFRGRVKSGPAPGKLEIRLDSPTGEVIGQCSVTEPTWVTEVCTVLQVGERQTVYLCLEGELHISWFQFF